MLSNLRAKWLVLRGYEFYRCGITSWSWDGEYPPMYGYYPNIWFKKGISIKKISFKKLAFGSEKAAGIAVRDLVSGLWS